MNVQNQSANRFNYFLAGGVAAAATYFAWNENQNKLPFMQAAVPSECLLGINPDNKRPKYEIPSQEECDKARAELSEFL